MSAKDTVRLPNGHSAVVVERVSGTTSGHVWIVESPTVSDGRPGYQLWWYHGEGCVRMALGNPCSTLEGARRKALAATHPDDPRVHGSMAWLADLHRQAEVRDDVAGAPLRRGLSESGADDDEVHL